MMTSGLDSSAPVLVIGAGIMGAGIAQVAAQAGHPVSLFDAREGAAAEAIRQLGAKLDKLTAKGKLAPDGVRSTLARLRPVASLDEARDAALVVEAIVENLDVKRTLFRQLEAIVADDCVIATNTSSISVTALANGLRFPGRLVGMHFFNPVPLMKLVEVVSGLQSDAAVAGSIFDLARAWGKVPVHARSTPGFIVNRIARPFYAETLALLQERAAEPQVLDACMRAAGYRMGPCELMDLIGHDTNLAVANSVFEAHFFDKRFVPSLVQRELINEAADAVQQGVCDEADADAAMKLGVNYPAGPFEWLAAWDAAEVVSVLDALDARYRGERYRASPRLRYQEGPAS